MIKLKSTDTSASIDAGELVSYHVLGHEYIHQKGSPGWPNADTEMFPIIGPTSAAKYQVQTPRDMAIQDQHGLLREMEYQEIKATENTAIFQKKYVANSPIKNSKYPEKSDKEFVFWPYDFVFMKRFILHEKALEIQFKVDAPRDTPFMFGYHPAFKLHTVNPVVVANEQVITLDEILKVGSRAYAIPNCNELVLKDTQQLQIKTSGFGNFMLWTEVRNMLCIDPITFYPYAVSQLNLHEGFQYTQDEPVEFTIHIKIID